MSPYPENTSSEVCKSMQEEYPRRWSSVVFPNFASEKIFNIKRKNCLYIIDKQGFISLVERDTVSKQAL